MVPELMWIIGFYVAAAALAHVAFGRGADARKRHYVLVAGNHQLQIEWYVRELQLLSRRTGTDIGITVVLEDSTDETGPILEKFVRKDEGVGFIRSREREVTRDGAIRQLEQMGAGVDPRDIVWVELGEGGPLRRLSM